MPPSATAAFNPSDVSASDAATWCSNQLANCPLICGQNAWVNTCNATSFTYTCICVNGRIPDCTAYQNTLPYFMCVATYEQCIDNNPIDTEAEAVCKNNEACGSEDPEIQPLDPVTSHFSTPSAIASLTSSKSSSFSTQASPSTSSGRTSPGPAAGHTSTSSNKASSTSTSQSPSALPASSTSTTSHSLSSSIAAGIGIGCTLFALAVIFIVSFLLLRRRRRSRKTTEVESGPYPTPPSENPETSHPQKASAKNPSPDLNDKTELTTDTRRHEMEDTGMTSKSGGPCPVELPAHEI
jgi:hypothetical protein